MRTFSATLCGVLLFCNVAVADPFTIRDAINRAVATNPAVGEVTANRRATDAQLYQSQGVLLPQVRLETRTGPEKITRDILPTPIDNGNWKNGREGSVVIRQLVFDGLTSINQIWQQAARVDAAASRVHERSELIALDATEAYIDVMRYLRVVSLAQTNVQAHSRILSNVRARFSGGRAGEGDLQQAIEREASARAVLAEFRNRLEDARAAFRKTIGIEPYNLRDPNRLANLPSSKDEALSTALKFNPTIRAAQFDVNAAKYSYRSTAGAFVPSVSLEGRALRGWDSVVYDGRRDEVSGKVVLSWDVFRGGQDSWKRVEAAERMIEESARHARLQRDAFQTVDKAWAARTITSDRVAELTRAVDASRKVVVAYGQEYELGQRTLVDLLNSENQKFNDEVSLVSARGVAVFADYQLLAVMGQLLSYLKSPYPIESAPTKAASGGIIPFRIAPILFNPFGSDPEKINESMPRYSGYKEPQETTFEDRFTPGDRP